MSLFRDLPIRRALTLVILLTGCAVLLLAGGAFLAYETRGLHGQLRALVGLAGLVLAATLLLTVIISLGLNRLISKPILALADTARTVKENHDYAIRVPALGRNEIGLLADAFNQLLSETGVSQTALQQANSSLQDQAAQISESVSVLSSSARQILDFSARVAASATETADAVTQTTATFEQVRQTAQLSSQKARIVADGSQRMAQTSLTGKQSTDDTAQGMRRIKQQMDSIADSMVRLSEQTQAIGQIIAAVDDLAAQSNLLAVNAAIEAAKAGEQGKGFTVVAQEVKSLAEQSKQATAQVRAILNDIQKATGAAVLATEQGAKAVETGVKQSAQAGESIQALANSMADSAQAATQIAASSQQQLIGVDQVASAMESIRQASTQNAASAKQMEDSARDLNELGRKLKALVEQHEE